MKLLDLTDDALLPISEAIEPEDFDAFLASSKRLHAIAQHRLPQHRHLKRQYRRYTIDKENHPASILHDI